MLRFNCLRSGVAILALGMSVPHVVAQTDPLERAKALQRFHDQTAESDVKEAIALAGKLKASHPEKAAQNLKSLRVGLDLRTDISSTKRDALIEQINGAIKGMAQGPALRPLDPKIAILKDENKKAFSQASLEAKEIADAVAKIAKDFDENRIKDAQRKIAELAAKYPANPAAFHLKHQGATAAAIDESRDLSNEQGRRFLIAQNDIANSALPAIGDIEYPKGWKEKMERRRKLELPLLGPEEIKILEALEKPVTGGTKSAPFEESIQSLSTLVDLNIYLDKKSIDDVGADLRKPVDIPGNVSARTALRAMLQSQGLTFIIKDKILQVVSVEKARENMVTRSYEIRDLVQTGGAFNGAVTWGPYLDFQQTQQNAQMMIDAISGSIDPMVWKGKSGQATITFHYPSMSLIVRAPSEVHADLGKSLGKR